MRSNPFASLSDAQLLALTIYGEARGESAEGKIAVGSVVLERVRRQTWYGKTVQEVCLKPWQFSCFNEADPNRGKLINIAEKWDEAMAMDASLNDCYGISSGLLDGSIAPNVKATHYKTIRCNAEWAERMHRVTTIGNHEYFEEV